MLKLPKSMVLDGFPVVRDLLDLLRTDVTITVGPAHRHLWEALLLKDVHDSVAAPFPFFFGAGVHLIGIGPMSAVVVLKPLRFIATKLRR